MSSTSTSTREVGSDLLPRLEAAARSVADCDSAASDARALRDDLVVRAVDEGFRQRDVARAARVSHARVIAILSNSQPAPDPRPEAVHPEASAA